MVRCLLLLSSSSDLGVLFDSLSSTLSSAELERVAPSAVPNGLSQ